MTIRMNPQLCCNGADCTNAFAHTFGLEHGYQIRAEAAAAGWVERQNGKDYCPTCAPSIGPKYVKPRGQCPECPKDVSLNADGQIRGHDAPLSRGAGWAHRCPGSYRKPKVVQS